MDMNTQHKMQLDTLTPATDEAARTTIRKVEMVHATTTPLQVKGEMVRPSLYVTGWEIRSDRSDHLAEILNDNMMDASENINNATEVPFQQLGEHVETDTYMDTMETHASWSQTMHIEDGARGVIVKPPVTSRFFPPVQRPSRLGVPVPMMVVRAHLSRLNLSD
jgi:hypothetical protein